VVGKVVSAGQKFIQSWEDLSIDIWGPRTGKSTSRVMPAILNAPGVVASKGKERIFDVSNLAELDRGRAVVLVSGAPATLVRTMPWYTGTHKDAVEASHQKYSPRPEEEAVPVAVAPVANPWVTG
jgi:hypothetical protein